MGPPLRPPSASPRFGRRFVPVIFAVGVLLTGAVLYVGLSGVLTTAIPGSRQAPAPAIQPLADCQGHSDLGVFHFLIVADLKGGLTFNGSSPGPCFAVAVGSNVSVTLEVSSQGSFFAGWVLINGTGPTDLEPAFAGAGEVGGARASGIAPGSNVTFSFVPTVAGAYRYVSEVAGEAAAGMWGAFNVTANASATVSVAGTGTAAATNPLAASTAAVPGRRGG
ncbi:MAG: sulfocyanin-like copper-binding protein [Thermoplasmata archaeon]